MPGKGDGETAMDEAHLSDRDKVLYPGRVIAWNNDLFIILVAYKIIKIMGQSLVKNCMHIIFSTKNRHPFLLE